jgi:hypothetical protein
VIAAGGLGTVILSVGIVLSPSIYAFVVEQVLLPRLEKPFGFRGGRIVSTDTDPGVARYGILEVTPGGRLDRAGVRPGDVPVDTTVAPLLSTALCVTRWREGPRISPWYPKMRRRRFVP